MSQTSFPAVTTSVVNTIVAPAPIVGQEGGTVGFFGSEGTTKAVLPADATDLATAEALVNAIKAHLIALGLAE